MQNSLARWLPYIFILILLSVVMFILSPPELKLKDLPEFYAPGRMLIMGKGSEIYDPSALNAFEKAAFPDGYETPQLYVPPFSLPLLIPIGLLPGDIVNKVWFAFLILCTTASFVLLAKTLDLSGPHVLRAGTILVVSGPIWEAVRHGQLAPLALLSLTASLYFLKMERPLSSALSLAPMLTRPQELLPLLVFCLAAGRWKLIACVAATTAILYAVACLLFGSAAWEGYFQLLTAVKQNKQWMAAEVSPTVRGQLLRIFPTADNAVMIAAIIVMLSTLACLFILGRKYKDKQDWWQYGFVISMPAGLGSALHCHNYDLLLLAPAVILFVLGEAGKAVSLRTKILWLLPGIIYLMPIYAKIHYEYILLGGVANPFFIMLAIWSVAILVFYAHQKPTGH